MPAVAQWEEITVPTEDNFRQIVVTRDFQVYVLGDQRIWTSNDGVGSWQEIVLPDSAGTYRNIVAADNFLVALGSEVLRSEDPMGGWETVLRAEDADGPFQSFVWFSEANSFCSDDVSSYASTDDAKTFTKIEPPILNTLPSPTMEWYRIFNGIGYAAGGRESLNSRFAAVSRTSDSGRTWEPVYLGEREGFVSLFNAVDAVERFDVCAVGFQAALDAEEPSGLVVFSRDSGRTWRESETPFDVPVIDVVYNSRGHVYCLDILGRVYRSLSGGADWVPLDIPDDERVLTCIQFGPEGYLYAAGEGGYLIRTGVPTSVEEEKHVRATSVYPNPATGFITVETVSGIRSTVALHSLLGEQLQQTITDTGSTTFDVSGLASGTYLVVVTTGGAYTTMQIVVR